MSVSDTGIGIPPEFLPYVFDRFRQAEGGTTRAFEGLGLGLSIVRHIVELHGGSVYAASEGTGRGATFTVRLPLTLTRRDPDGERVHSAARAAVPFEPTRSLTGSRVLVVDDEPDTRELLAFILSSGGAEVRAVGSAAEALTEMSAWAPDLLLSDIGMPGEDGYVLIARVREHASERLRRVPAVALTAYARAEDRVRMLSAGFDSHLAKPVEPAELTVLAASLIRRSRS